MKRQLQSQLDRRLITAREIRAAGIPIYIAEDDDQEASRSASGLLVYQTGGFEESTLFDHYGGVGVALRIAITIDRWGFAIADFGLELPWTDQISWLPDPSNSVSSEYRFTPQHGLALPRRDVLNHHADVRRVFRRGKSLAGYLLGIGNEPIPEDIRHGTSVPAFLIIYDQFWHPHRFPVCFWADRSARLESRKRCETPRPRIFEQRDPAPETVGGLGCGSSARSANEMYCHDSIARIKDGAILQNGAARNRHMQNGDQHGYSER